MNARLVITPSITAAIAAARCHCHCARCGLSGARPAASAATRSKSTHAACARTNAPRWRVSAASHTSSSRCSASGNEPASRRITQYAAVSSMSSISVTILIPFPCRQLRVGIALLQRAHDEAQRLDQMFLDGAFRQLHALRDLPLRQLAKLAQLERLAAFWRQLRHDLPHALDLLAPAEPPLRTDVLVRNVQHFDVGHGFDRHHARAPQHLSNHMAGGDEEIRAWIQ